MSPHTDPGELLPCPFCGGKPYLHGPDNPGHEYWISCQSCQASSVMRSNYAAAESAWNTRQAASQGSAGGEHDPADVWENYIGEVDPEHRSLQGALAFGFAAALPKLTAAGASLQNPQTSPERPDHAQGVKDPILTPRHFLDDILAACDASNWDADRNKGDYYRGLNDAYETILNIAVEYQTSIYAWCKREATSVPSASRGTGA